MSNLPKWLVSDPRPSLETHTDYPNALRCGYVRRGAYFYDEYGESWRIKAIMYHENGGIVFVTAYSNGLQMSAVFKPQDIQYVEIPANE